MSENPATTSTAIATNPKKTFLDFVQSDKVKAQLVNALPKHLTADRFIRVLLTATMRQPKLLECTQESLLKGIMDCAAAGLELDGRRAHLVPLRNGNKLEANLWFDYKGLAELAMRSGSVSNIHADVVCENDVFEVDRGQITKHVVNYRRERGAMYAAYCLIRMKDGGEKAEVMGKDEINAVRARSPGKNATPWTEHFNEMAKKTAAKRAFKWVPLSPEIREAIETEADAPPPMVNVTGSAIADTASQSLGSILGDEKNSNSEPEGDTPGSSPSPAEKSTPSPTSGPATEPSAAYTEADLKKVVTEVENLALNLQIPEATLMTDARRLGASAKVSKIKELPYVVLLKLREELDLKAQKAIE